MFFSALNLLLYLYYLTGSINLWLSVFPINAPVPNISPVIITSLITSVPNYSHVCVSNSSKTSSIFCSLYS